MGCNCGQRQDSALAGTTLRQSFATSNSAGLYDLARSPGCKEPYHGSFPTAVIYVVALGTEDEQLFTRGQRNDATRRARTGRASDGSRLTLDSIAASNLCHDAVVELLGS
ncbi:MAG: hypothetical protein K0Q89_1 [Thermomicrobiales bacterium]|jgi:hypothetical protein|nr:hypothetical protein [Thermomicrobiales bacterium]